MVKFRSLVEFDTTEGTVKLLDESQLLKKKGGSNVVLIPQPTNDPNDPHNWPRWKKNFAFLSSSFLSLAASWSIGGLGPAIPLLMKDSQRHSQLGSAPFRRWGKDLSASRLSQVFVAVPATLYLRTRPVVLLSLLLFIATCVWSALTNDFGSLDASKVINTFATSCGDALPAIVVKDIFFLHERGWWMGVYMVFFQCLPSLLVIMSGFVITGVGWRWHLWIMTIVASVDLLIFFFFPETQYRSPPPTVDPINEPSKDKSTTVEVGEQSVPIKKSYLQEISPWSGINPGSNDNPNFFFLLIRPWPLAIYPAVIYAFLVFSFNLACLLFIVNTAPVVFQSPPYNFTPSIQSLIFLPAFVGAGLGAFTGGALTDQIIQWLTKRNDGIFEPESRLVAFIFPLFLVPADVLMYGLGVANSVSWPLPYIGLGFATFGLRSLPTITMTYVVDSYFSVAPEAVLLIVGLKNVFGFGFAYGVIPWLTAWGYSRTFGTMAGIQFGVVLLGLPLWYFGKSLRHVTAKWKIIMW